MLQSQLTFCARKSRASKKEIEAHNGLIATNKRQLEDIKEHAEQYGKLVKQGLGLANSRHSSGSLKRTTKTSFGS